MFEEIKVTLVIQGIKFKNTNKLMTCSKMLGS